MKLPKLQKTLARPYPPLILSLFNLGYFNKKNWTKFLGFPYLMPGMLYSESIIFYPEEFLTTFPKRLTNKLFAEKKYLNHLKRETAKLEKNIRQGINKDFNSYIESFIGYVPPLGIYHVCDDLIEQKIRNLLLKKLNPNEVDEIMHYLNLPLNNNIGLQEKLDLLRTKDLKQHLEKYFFLNSRYGQFTPYTLSQAKKKKAELIKEDFLKHYKYNQRQTKKAIIKARQVLGKKYAHLTEVMQYFVYYRTQRTDVFNMVITQYRPQFKKIARSKNITYQELLYCLISEVLNNQIPSKTELKKRMKSNTIIGLPSKDYIYSGDQSRAWHKKYNPKQTNLKQFKGQTAHPGLAKGNVILIKHQADLSKVKSNNILVASMTTPVMAPAMARSAGIITNEGGITCHAAILARELKKPCIISTKIATEVLKNGDKVELNANKSIIKKL